MSSIARVIAVFGISLGLAACTGQTIMYSDAQHLPRGRQAQYDAWTLNYVASRGGMLTQVVGNPFAVPKQEVEAVVTRIFTRDHPGPRFPFFTEPPDDYISPYRVVVLFNPARNANVSRLCERPQQPTWGRDGVVEVTAVLCTSERVVTKASGAVLGASGPQDPRFEDLMQQVVVLLLPVDTPKPDGGRGEFDD